MTEWNRITSSNNEIKTFGSGREFFYTLIYFSLGMSNDGEKKCHSVDKPVHDESPRDEDP
jgi:hypothetical protein